ncbi:MAG: SCP2 sterol-binding domain-containing protein [Thiopseudomonas sp.]|nr:SCP2 sterol-binding domain-containing protein [Gammaproteobacteria bacterium]
MSAVAEHIKTYTSRFNADAAAGLDLVFQFNIEGAGNYHLVVKDGSCAVQEGANADANVTLSMDAETFEGLASGETDGMQAFMMGKLSAEGDMMLAMKLNELFPG